MQPLVARSVLVASGLGFPMTQAAIRRLGRPGAILVEAVAAGLLVRDLALVATGAPGRLRRGPAFMLYAETVVAAASAGLCLPLIADDGARRRASGPRPSALEALRRFALGTLFGLHTMRFRIYLQPDRGRRPSITPAKPAA
jgi:hypothetical protein